MSSYKVIDGFLSKEETADKINVLVALGYDEKDVVIMTKKENADLLKNMTIAKIETISDDGNKGMLDRVKETFSKSDEENPLGKYDLEEHIKDQYNPIVKEGGYVILVEDKTSLTMGRESETNQPSENTDLTKGETGDYNETPGGINPLIPGTGVDADEINKKPGDVRSSGTGGTNVQDKFSSATNKETEENEKVTKANEAINNASVTGDSSEPIIPGFGIDPKIPPQSSVRTPFNEDETQPHNIEEAELRRRELNEQEDQHNRA